MKNKILAVVVTRNNAVLLQHITENWQKYDPGYPVDFLIIDNSSDDVSHLKVLDKLSSKYTVKTLENNRVEVGFDWAWQNNKDYEYYFFMHDDGCPNKNDWLKAFVDRLKSTYSESILDNTQIKNLPIGRVGAMHQPYRSYSSIQNYPVQCMFLEKVLEVLSPGQVPPFFKFADPDRVLMTNECLSEVGLIYNVENLSKIENDKFEKIASILDKYLPYYDEGIPPKSKYPPGQCFNKLTMTSEFLNSVMPLIKGYRTVGLDGTGFLEQIHGYDEGYGNDYIHHYGMPSTKQFLAKAMNTDPNEISKNLNNKVFLMKCDMLIKKYNERKR
jgi:hypothetical protein